MSLSLQQLSLVPLPKDRSLRALSVGCSGPTSSRVIFPGNLLIIMLWAVHSYSKWFWVTASQSYSRMPIPIEGTTIFFNWDRQFSWCYWASFCIISFHRAVTGRNILSVLHTKPFKTQYHFSEHRCLLSLTS